MSFHNDCITYISNYTYLNWSYHYEKCYCGNLTSQVHLVKMGTSICAMCNETVSMGGIRIMSTNNKTITENGSYIMPNGVIVLDESDFVKYINGELKINIGGITSEKI